MEKLSAYFDFKNLIHPQVGSSTIYPDAYVNVGTGGYQKCCVVVSGYIGNGNNCVCTLLQANDSGGTGNQALAITTNNCVLTGNATSTKVIGVIDVDVMSLKTANNNQMFLGVKMLCQNTGDYISAVLIRGDARYLANNSTTL
jgi:hypothetical protein